jgi:hypothetical protein
LSLLLLAWALLYVVSAWADKTLAKNILGYYRKTIYSVLGAVFLLFFLLFAKIYGEMDFLLKTDRGSFFVPACYGQVYAKTINWLKGNTDKNDTVIALPEGAWLNFLLERKYPYYYIQWMPYFMPSLEREFKTKPSDIVILMWPWGCQFWPWGYNSLEPSLDFSSQVLSKSLTHDYSKVFTDKSSCYAYIGLSKVKLDNYTVIYQRKKP